MKLKYHNECYVCDHKWDSEEFDNPCPVCGEDEKIGTDNIDETPNQTPKIQ